MQQKIPKINNFELFFPKSDPDNYDQFIEPLRFFYFCYNGKAIYIKILKEKNRVGVRQEMDGPQTEQLESVPCGQITSR